MGRLGFGELIVILAIVLLFVGAKRLPELARSLGQAVREFQKALKGDHDDDKEQ
ncbi:MAG: twin-arginine translocase TatA/TatE family subunit [Candidatus Omnitrophica bacterium]|nr:twin-arginine translocase TatA/TatE family subunit [Candidatus Omnitrophota bacterium]